jgi:hypothetical protein
LKKRRRRRRRRRRKENKGKKGKKLIRKGYTDYANYDIFVEICN